ncbi:MAG: Limonene hydroxylase [Firmicutes bacterium]|nr:Limonene hydroxylase [candidate division NPL-UPA2 bacterium]
MKGKDALLDAHGFLPADKTLIEAKLAFELYNLEYLALVNAAGKPVGVLSRRRMAECVQNGILLTTPAAELANRAVPSVRREEEALQVLDADTPAVFLVDAAGKALSLLTRQTLLRSYFDRLEVADANLRAIIEAIDAALIAVDAAGKIVYANSTAENIIAECGGREALGANLGDSLRSAQHEKATFFTTLAGRRYRVRAVPLRGRETAPGAMLVLEDISEQEVLKHELEHEKRYSDILKTILEIAYDGIVVVDKRGYITMMSQAYLNFLDLKEEDAVGRHVTEVIENTRMHIVLETGIPEIADLQLIRGDYMIATRIPMISNGEVVGAVGKVLFRKMSDLEALHDKLSKMEEQLELYKGQINTANRSRFSFASIVGNSPAIAEVKRHAAKAALSDATVLVLGESGVGKEVFAQAIHAHSKRAAHPFVRVNCAAIPNDLLEMEFFGYEEGSFLGARPGGKAGKFEIADGGTLFLDEIADMPLSMQAKILRVLQEREVEKIGAETPKRVDVRIIVSSNQDLEERVRLGFLRRDLYYRISSWSLMIPPLRDRKEDLTDLVEHILDKYIQKYGKYIEGISEKAMGLLHRYAWPGNVRELENELERAIGQLDKDWVIQPRHLSEKITEGRHIEAIQTLEEIVLAAERQAIEDCLRLSANNKAAAAKLLGIGRTSLYEKMQKHNLLGRKEESN